MLSLDPINDTLIPKITPLEYYLINTIHLKDGNVAEDELIEKAVKKFWMTDDYIKTILNSLIDNDKSIIRYTEFQQETPSSKSFLSLSDEGIFSTYPRIDASIDLGGRCHLESGIMDIFSTIKAIVDHNVSNDKYCVVNLVKDSPADIIIYSYQSKIEKEYTDKDNGVDPDCWSSKIMATKIEIDPIHHKDKVIGDYKQNTLNGMYVNFIVYNKSDMIIISDVLLKYGINESEYGLFRVPSGE